MKLECSGMDGSPRLAVIDGYAHMEIAIAVFSNNSTSIWYFFTLELDLTRF
jgi:hypothetical protein